MAWLFRVDFQGGSGWEDITALVALDSIQRVRGLHNDLKPTIDSMTFRVNRNATLINSFLSNTLDTLVNVQSGGADYFTGTVRSNFEIAVGEQVGQMKIECVGNGDRLKDKIDTSFVMAGYKVSNATTKTESIIHQLLVKAGFDVDDDIDIPTIDKTVDYFVNIAGKDSPTYQEAITKVLYEFGYVWYFDASGVFHVYDVFPSSVSATETLDNSNMRGAIKIARKIRKIEGVAVSWSKHFSETDVVIFSDTTGGDAENKCNITLAAGEYYPIGADSNNVYSEYVYNDFEIIYASGASLDTEKDANITESITSYFKRALVVFENTGGTDQDITKFDIVGDVVYKGDEQRTKCLLVASSEKIEEIQTDYITDSGDADKLTIGLARRHMYSAFTYQVESSDAFNPGDIVTISEDMLGFSTTAVILAASDVDVVLGTRIYTLEGLAAYSAETTTIEGTQNAAPALPPNVDNVIETAMTKTDYISGFTDSGSGGTTTPTTPTIAECRGMFRGIFLMWDRQLNLTNFDRYEVQVSSDDSTWYSLKFDGTDWKDTLAADTNVLPETLVHANIPLDVTGGADDPAGVTLYYRVRRVTKASVYSSWSTSASATTLTIKAGDLAENIIYANNIIAAEIETMLLRAAQLWVGYEGTGTKASPDEGDRRIYQDGDEIIFQEYTDSAWTAVNSIRLGGVDSNGVFISGVSCRQVVNPLADEISQEFFPGGHIVTFESNYDTQDGYSPSANAYRTRTTAWSKFGAYSVTGNSLIISGNLDYNVPTGEVGAVPCALSYWFKKPYSGTGTNEYTHGLFYGQNSTHSFALSIIYNYAEDKLKGRITHSVIGVSTDTWDTAYISTPVNNEYYITLFYTPNETLLTLGVDCNYTSVTTDVIPALTPTVGGLKFFRLDDPLRTDYPGVYLDEFCGLYDESIVEDLFTQHYNHNVPWNTDYSAKDLILRPADGGYVNLTDSPTKYYAPVSGEESVGVFHPVGSSGTWNVSCTNLYTSPYTLDLSTIIPIGAQWVEVQAQLFKDSSGLIGGDYAYVWDYDTAYSANFVLTYGLHFVSSSRPAISGTGYPYVGNDVIGKVKIGDSRKLKVGVLIANQQINVKIRGYYI